MRILFLCHRFPLPATGGGKIRALHVARHLAKMGHAVTVAGLTRSVEEERGADELRAEGFTVLAHRVNEGLQVLRMALNLFTTAPSSFGYFESPQFGRRVARALVEHAFDMIIVHCSSVAHYVAGAHGVPKLLDFVDMDSQKWADYARHKLFPSTLFYALESVKLARRERSLGNAFDACATISSTEHETLRNLGIVSPADWFPNGVDLSYFTPPASYDANVIAFVGRMDYYPNQEAMLWFCEAVWPLLRRAREDLRLRIVGADPPRGIRRLGELAGVVVTGFVPDVRPHVGAAAVGIAPLRIARGLQNKVLECMALGVPVVVSDVVARGLGLEGESPVRVAAAPEDYAREILAVVGSADLRQRLSLESRALVEQHFSWPRALARLESIVRAARAGASVPRQVA